MKRVLSRQFSKCFSSPSLILEASYCVETCKAGLSCFGGVTPRCNRTPTRCTGSWTRARHKDEDGRTALCSDKCLIHTIHLKSLLLCIILFQSHMYTCIYSVHACLPRQLHLYLHQVPELFIPTYSFCVTQPDAAWHTSSSHSGAGTPRFPILEISIVSYHGKVRTWLPRPLLLPCRTFMTRCLRQGSAMTEGLRFNDGGGCGGFMDTPISGARRC
jgi:hypothetical protein